MASRGVYLTLFSGASQALYAPFSVINGQLVVYGTYYAMLSVHAALGGDGAIVYQPLGTQPSLRLKAWGVWNPSNNLHSIVIVHKDTSAAVPVTITAPAGMSKARVIHYTAPSLSATTGLTFAGMTMPSNDSNAYVEQVVTPDSAGKFLVSAKSASVTIVRISAEDAPIMNFNNDPSVFEKNGNPSVPGMGGKTGGGSGRPYNSATGLSCIYTTIAVFLFLVM